MNKRSMVKTLALALLCALLLGAVSIPASALGFDSGEFFVPEEVQDQSDEL